MNPEQILFKNHVEDEAIDLKAQFESLSNNMKINKIKGFIRKNRRKTSLQVEVATARKLLKSLEA